MVHNEGPLALLCCSLPYDGAIDLARMSRRAPQREPIEAARLRAHDCSIPAAEANTTPKSSETWTLMARGAR